MILEKSELPSWFEYPSEFLILINQNLLDFDPWIVITGDRLKTRYAGIKERYPNRGLIPFARREDNDDLACFEKDSGVVIIHDFATPGYEGGRDSMLFWEWLRMVVEDMIEYNT